MADQNTSPQASQALQVTIPDELKKGTYSNAISVNVNSNEVVVDFGYLLPNTQSPVIEVVSRVNMNQKTAESFLNVLSGAMDDFKRKQAEQVASQAVTPAPMPAAAPAPTPLEPQAPTASMPAPVPASNPLPSNS